MFHVSGTTATSVISVPAVSVSVVMFVPANWLAAVNASSEEPPAANTSLNVLNAALSFEDDSRAVLKLDVAFEIAVKSPDSIAFLNLKADAASLASLLPVNEEAASSMAAVSPLPIAARPLNTVAIVLTAGGTLAPLKVRPVLITPVISFLSNAFKPPAIFFVVLIRPAFCASILLSYSALAPAKSPALASASICAIVLPAKPLAALRPLNTAPAQLPLEPW